MRDYIQSLIDAGGEQRLPAGEYTLEQDGDDPWNLRLCSGVRLLPPATGRCVLRQAAGMPKWVRMFSSQAEPVEDVALVGFEIDGNGEEQEPDGHRAGIFLHHASRVSIEGVTIHGMTGDGIHVYQGCQDIDVDRVQIADNGRSGVALTGGGTSGVHIDRSRIVTATGQAVDGEVNANDTPADDVSVTRCYLENSGGGYGLTMGANTPHSNRGWVIDDNRIIGGVNAVGSTGSRIVNNRITSTDKPAVKGYFTTYDLLVGGNTIDYLGDYFAVVSSYSHDAYPVGQKLVSNTIESAAGGILAWGVDELSITGNTIRGTTTGMHLRATRPTYQTAVIGNQFRGFDVGLLVGPGTYHDLVCEFNQYRDVETPEEVT